MPTLIQTLNGTVSGLWGGVALVRSPDGKVRVLQLGDKVAKGDVIITTQDGIVELSPDQSVQVAAATPSTDTDTDSELDRIIAEVDNPTPDTAPAAGLSGGDGGGLQPGLRVDRVAEGTTPAGLLPTDYTAPAAEQPVAASAPSEPAEAPAPEPAPMEVTLTSSAGTVAEGGSLTFTATVVTPVTGAPLVITLTNGTTVVIPVGETSGTSAPILVRPDDVQAQGVDVIEVGIAGAAGGNGAGLVPTAPVRADVVDDVDFTSLTLTSSSATVGEGGSVVFTVGLNAPVAGSPLVITLSNGQIVTVPVGSSTGSSAPFFVRADDMSAQGNQGVSVEVTGTSGGQFEALAATPPVALTVTDTPSTTTVTLSASSSSVSEGGSLVYTATTSSPVAGAPLVLTLSNGQTITIPVGSSTGSSAPFAVRADDAYVQGSERLTVGVANAAGGDFETTTFTSATSLVTDQASTTTVALSASSSTVTEGGSITYTATVTSPVTGSPLVVTLTNGQTITIPVGQSAATGPAFSVRPDDVQQQGNQALTVGVSGTSGGNFEALVPTATASTLVSDDADSTTLSLGASTATVAEGGSVIYTATLGSPVAGSPLVLTLSNGQTITIPVGESTGSTAPFLVRADDAYVQGTDTLSVSISNQSGGTFEGLTVTSTAQTSVTDDGDQAIVTVSASSPSVAEGGSISYTVAVSAPVTGSPLVVTLSNGQVLTIPVGDSKVTGSPVPVRPDDAQVQGAEQINVSITGTSGGNFEAVNTASTASTTVTDQIANTTLTLSASTGSVAEGGSVIYTATLNNPVAGAPLVLTLSNGQTITIPVGESTGATVPFLVRADDAYVQGTDTLNVSVTNQAGGNFEGLTVTSTAQTAVNDDGDQAIVTVSASSPSVAEGGSISYTVAVSAPVTGSPLVVTLSNGQVLTIPVGDSRVTGSPVAVRPDDAQAQGDEQINVSITGTSGGNFEAVNTASTASTTVTDQIANTTLTLSASTGSVAEGGSVIYTATLNNPVAGAPLVLTLSNGQTITIPVGESTGATVPFLVRADDAYVQGTDTLNVSVTNQAGGNFEGLTVTSTAQTAVTDDGDQAAVTVSASSSSVAEGGSISYTVAVSAPVTGSPLVVTLSNGQVLTIPVGDSRVTGSPVAVRPDDAQAQGDETINVSITGTSGGNFEAVNTASTASTTVTDEIANTTLVLSASTGSVAEGGSVIYTATLNNPVAGAPLVLTLSNGQTITIPVGESTGSTAPFLVRADDAYVQGTDTLSVSISNQSGGTFEGLTVTSTAQTSVTDDGDQAMVTVSASSPSVAEGGSISYTVAVSAPVTGSPLVVTLSNGQVLTIPVGDSRVTGSPVAVRPDDAQAQGDETIKVSITGTSGGNFEAVNTASTASTTVTDDIANSTLVLSASTGSVAEGGSVIYTATLNNPVAGAPLVLTLSNGQTITIPVGESTGATSPFLVRADDAYVQGADTLNVSVTNQSGGTFEGLTVTSTAQTTVTDDADAAVITVTPSATSVAEGGSISYTVAVSAPVTGSPLVVTLSNGQVLTIPVGDSRVTGSPVAVRPDDAQAQGAEQINVSITGTSGGNFEAVNTASTASTTVTDEIANTTLVLSASTGSVAEGGSVIYTATLNNPVAGAPLVLTLSNGQTITIPVGESTGATSPFLVRADDAYVQGTDTLIVSVTNQSGGNFEGLTVTSTAQTAVTDDADAAVITVTPSATSVAEGGSISYTVAVSAPVTGSPLVVTLSNGQVLTIPVGDSRVTGSPVAVRPDDAQAQGDEQINVSITGTSGGNFEAVNTASTASTTVTDDIANSTLVLSASTGSVAEGGSVIYTATLNNPVAGAPLVLTLSNGQTITIPVGESTGATVPFLVRADDAYVQGTDTLNVSVTNQSGGTFEGLTVTSTAQTSVTDDGDQAIVTVSASSPSVAEGGSISYTVAVSAPVTGSPLVVTLSNGQVLTIPVGDSRVTGSPVAVRPDDAQAQGDETINVSITGTSGGNFEAVNTASTASTTVTDDIANTTLVLSASTGSVAEGGSVIYTATLNNPVAGAPLVLTLSNGQTITIPVGESTGTTSPFLVRADDAYIQGTDTFSVSISNQSGGTFEGLTVTSTAQTTVTDDADAAVITVTPSATSVAEGGSISYTVAVSAPVTGSPLVVTLSNGQVLTIPVGDSRVTGSPVAVRPDDAQAQGDEQINVSITGTSGGNFEAVNTASTASTTVTDDIANSTLVLSASTGSVAEGGSVIYTATLNNPVAGAPLVLTLSNGQTITIPVGESTGSTAPFLVRADDAYVQGTDTLSVSISNQSGGTFEGLTVTSTAQTSVTDDGDQAIVTVSASSPSVAEGGSISYTVAVSAPVTGSPLVVTLSNGQVLTIPVGDSKVTGSPVPVRPDDAQVQGAEQINVSITGTSGGNFEAVNTASTASTTVTDQIANTTLTLSASTGSVAEGGSVIYTATLNNPVAGAPLVLTLSNGQTITIPVGESTGATVPFLVRADDAYVQGTDTLNVSVTNQAGGNFEGLTVTSTAQTAVNDDGDQAIVTVSASSPSVAEGGSISYTVAVSAPVTGSPLVVTLSNGQVLTIPVGDSRVTGSPVAVRPDDAQAQGDEQINVSITGTSGGNFEAVNTASTASTTVTDQVANTTLTLSASTGSVAEGGSIIYTAALNNPVAGAPLVLTLSNGQTITIPVGESTGTTSPFLVRADDAYVQGTDTLNVSVTNQSGGTFEGLTVTSTAQTSVTDDADAAVITVTPSATSVAEGGSISYTVAVSAPVTGSPLVVTLSNGQVLTIPVGDSRVTGSPVAVRPDDAQAQGDEQINVSITGTAGGNFEAVNTASTASTTVTDDIANTSLVLSASTGSVAEGGSIIYTATLNNPVAGAPLVLTLSNGQTITIPVGESTGATSPFLVRADDAYVQGTDTLNVSVTNQSGGNFEGLTVTSTAQTSVTDDGDQAMVTVSASSPSVAEGGSISYTVAVSAPVTGSPLVVTLSNGQVLTIPVGDSRVTGSPVAVRPDDAQAQGDEQINVSITGTSGGNFEAVNTASTASTTVTDEIANTTLVLSASTGAVAEGGSIIYTATLNNPVAGAPLVLTLSNGQTITIPVGESTGATVPFLVRADDAYVQGTDTLNVSVSNQSGGTFEGLTVTSTAQTNVTDDADATVVTVTPSASSVVEGGSITYTVSVNQPVTGSAFVVTLSDGQVLSIPVGQSAVTGAPVAVRPLDAQAQGDETIVVSINGTSGGNYEAVTAAAPATTVVSDSGTSTTVSLSPSAASVVEGGSIVYTATLNNAVAGSPLVLTLSNGQTITIPVGASSGSSLPFTVRGDDAYVQGTDTLNVSVSGQSGGSFEALAFTTSAQTTVTDDADAAVVTITPSATSVVEGGSISYTVAVSAPVTGSPLVVTLSNGQVLTIPVGGSSVTGTPVAVRPDDVQVQGNQTVAVSISSTSGGNYEAVTATSSASTIVTDDADSTALTLTASASSVAEGGSIIYTATLNNAVAGSPLVLTLSNGQTITIPVGQSSGSSAPFNVRADDAYVQGNQTLDVTVASRTGGSYEAVTTTSTATTTVTDDADAAVVTITPSATSVVEGGSISYTVAVSAPVTGSPLAVTLSNGQVLTIPVGGSSVTGTPVAVRPDDVQVQGNQTVAVSISSTSGGNYEAVTATSSASTIVTDDADSTALTLTASASSVAEGGSIVYTATLSNPVAGSPLVLTLSNGQTITIPVGQSSGSSAPFNVRADDAYVQGNQTLDVTVSGRSGGTFEAVTTTSTATTTVTDDADAAVITVTPSATSVVEGGSISYTVAVSAPVTGSPLVVTLSNGQVLTIPVNQSSVTGAPVAVRPDDAQVQGNQTVAVSISSTSGGNYEAVTATSSASTVVTDDADSTTLNLTASTASVMEGGSIVYTATLNNAVAGSPLVLTLSNGQTITIPVGQSSGSSAPFNVRADDAYVQGNQTLDVTVSGRSGGTFEAVTTTSTATTTVTDDADAAVITVTPSATSVVEGGSISYTVAVSAPVTGSPLVVTLSNGQVVTIPVNQSSVTGAPVAVRPDDAQVQGNQTVAVSISSTSGGNYEAVTATSSASTVVTDDADSTTLNLTASTASVVEGGSIIYTATLNNAVAGSPLVLTLSNGQTITIPVGQSSGSSAPFNVRADDAYVQGNQTLNVTVATRTGGAYEAVTTTSTATTTVTDDADAAVVTVTPSATSVVEGGSISYTVAVSAPVTNSALVVTLSNGQVLTIPVGSSSVTGTPVAVRPDDVQVQGNQTVAVSISSTSGGNYEAVTATSSASTVVTDDADSTALTLTASASSVAEGGSIIYTATLSNPVAGSPFVLTLSNGQTITIPVGQSSGSSASFNVRADDAYVQGSQTLDVTVASRTGGAYEAVITTSTATTTVTDDADAAVITVTPSATSVVEGGSISYTVAVSAPVTGSPLVVTLSNGQVLTIPVGSSSVTGTPVAVRPDDVQLQGNQTVAVSISSTSGGNYEAVTATSSASIVVTDDADSTSLTLTASASSVAEGGSIIYTATLSNPVAGSPLVLTLSNGQTITIPVGQSSGSSAPFNVRADDAYVQGNQTLDVTVASRTGGAYEAVTTTLTATTTVTDDADAAVITVTPSATSVVEGGSISYTVAVSAPVTGSPLVVALSNGQTLTIPVGSSSVTGTPVAVRPDDAQIQGNQTVAVSVSSTSGGNYEAVTATSSASTVVTDDADSTSLTLTASASSVAEGGSIIYTATLNNAVADSPLVLTLSNGQTITIPVGQSSGSSAPFNVRTDDAYVQGNQTLDVTVASRTGGSFEAVTTTSTATTTVTDDADAAVITVTPSATSVVEGGSISYTVAVSAPVTGSPLVVTLSNGQVLTIPVGGSSVTGSPVAVRPDDAQVQGNQTVAVSISATSGGNYEAVTATSSASTVVTDDADSTTLTLTASAPSVVEGGSIVYTATLSNPVAGAPLVLTLSNGQTITIPVGQSSGSSAPFNVRADDAYVQGNQTLDVTVATRTGGAYEAVTTTSTATTTVTDDADAAVITVTPSATSVVEGGSISYTVAVSAPVTGSPLAVTLSNGQVLTIPVGGSSVTGAAVPVRADDALAQGAQTVTVGVSGVSGGNYEGWTSPAAASTTVNDDSDVTTISLSAGAATVAEGGAASFTLTLSAASASPVVVSLNYGGTATAGTDYTRVATVTIPAGSTSYTFTLPTVADGRDEADEALVVSIGSITGTGGFEAISAHPTLNTATTTVVDADPTPTLAISDVIVNEGAGTATFTVSLSAESGRNVTVNYGTVNGTAVAGSDFTSTSGTLTFAPGQTSLTVTVPITNDTAVEPTESFTVNLSGAVNATIADATGVATITDNDSAPVIDLDANNSSGATGANHAVTFTEGQAGAGVRIADTDLTITDADSTTLTSATITLTNRQPGDALNLGNSVAGISAGVVSTDTSVTITLTGTTSLANYLERIQNITFINNSEDPSTTPRTVTVQVNDGTNSSNLATTTINVVSVNDLPEGRDITITTAEDTARPFTLADFRMNDLEEGSNVSASAVRFDTLPTNGTLYVGGVAATVGQVVTAAQISAGAVTYAPNANDSGNGYATLTFSVRDGNGGYDASPNRVTVNVTAVDDGAPVAAADAFRTTLGTPITITQAQLLANDVLRDDARITGVSTASGGTLVNNGDGTYTFTPTTTGNATFTYTLTDADGQTSTASVTVNTVIARDDLATVHESALASGTGGGDLIATGTLMANDGGGTAINSIVHNGTSYSAVNGVITVDSALGRLVVQATGANAGSYTYTLETNANNSAAGTDLAVTEVFQYTSNAGVTASLRVNIVDDMPVVTDHDIAVSQVPLPSYNLVLVLDISGSMTTADYGGQVRRVNADGTSTVTTRLAMAKEALVQLVEQYYNQSQSVAIKIVTFSDNATILNNNNAFTSLAATVAAINGIAGTTSGGTNYQAALDAARSAYGTVNTSVTNATYFLSDGAPSTGNTSTALTTYGNFITANGIDSYGVGIGTGISSTDALDAIHNVDADGDGARDAAVIVPDLNQLGASLLSTVPPAFGGNLVGTSGTAVGSVLGADGGQVLNITVKLDSNGDGVPDRDVTFTYNASTNQISQNSSFLTGFPKTGDMLTLGSSTGFGKGTLIFNFSTGSYTYYTNGTAAEGDNFTLTFQARDGDGDLTPVTNLNFIVTNGAPIARPDTDTLQINETRLEGNVITGAGTDAGLALGTQVASFSQRGDGVDTAVDNAEVTSLQFQGRSFDLTTNSSGSGAGYTFVVSNGQLTWTGSGANAGSVLVFNNSGYYNYTPPSASLTGTPHDASVTNQLSNAGSANSNGVSVTAVGRPSATGVEVNYANAGAGVSSSGNSANTLGDLERLVFTFSSATHPYGVQNVRFNINTSSNLGPGTGALVGVIGALTYTVFDVTGAQIGQFYSASEGTVTLPSEYGNIGRIEVEANSVAEARISNISFESINLDATAPAVAPVEIGYTLTDDDGQSSSSTLTLGAISNNIYGTGNAETLTGTAANDRLVGLAGNDTLRGGEGHDTLEGGEGADRLEGGAGHDRLLGGDGSDTLEGGAGNDVLSGGRGNDVLTGGEGADVFRWEFAEQGVNGTPSVDLVTDFNNQPASAGGDVLDLRDLLQGETAAGAATGNLTSYLHFDTVGGSTTIQISTSGGFSGGYNAGAVDQSITLQGVDLTAAGSLNTDQQIIQDLLNKSKLVVDGGM